MRVFFSPRDQDNRSTIASLNLALDGSGESRLISNFSGLSLWRPWRRLHPAPREPVTNTSTGPRVLKRLTAALAPMCLSREAAPTRFRDFPEPITSTVPQELQTSLAGPGPSPSTGTHDQTFTAGSGADYFRRARHPIAWEAGYDQQLPDCRGASRHLHFHAEERGGVDKLRGRRRWHVYRNTSWRRRCQRHPGRQ